MRSAGFLKTLLLRRVGSSVAAGRATAKTMLDGWQSVDANELLAEHDQEPSQALPEEGRTLTEPERTEPEAFLAKLDANQGNVGGA